MRCDHWCKSETSVKDGTYSVRCCVTFTIEWPMIGSLISAGQTCLGRTGSSKVFCQLLANRVLVIWAAWPLVSDRREGGVAIVRTACYHDDNMFMNKGRIPSFNHGTTPALGLPRWTSGPIQLLSRQALDLLLDFVGLCRFCQDANPTDLI